jgi:hypothetical protein
MPVGLPRDDWNSLVSVSLSHLLSHVLLARLMEIFYDCYGSLGKAEPSAQPHHHVTRVSIVLAAAQSELAPISNSTGEIPEHLRPPSSHHRSTVWSLAGPLCRPRTLVIAIGATFAVQPTAALLSRSLIELRDMDL